MVISNLNIKLIEDRLGLINQSLARLKSLSTLQEGEFLEGDNPIIAESHIRRALEAIFDIGRHIIAKTAGKGLVEYKEIARVLSDRKIISKRLAERLRLMAGYRNRLIHFYHEVTDKELFSIVSNHLSDIEAFIKEIKTFIEKYRKRT